MVDASQDKKLLLCSAALFYIPLLACGEEKFYWTKYNGKRAVWGGHGRDYVLLTSLDPLDATRLFKMSLCVENFREPRSLAILIADRGLAHDLIVTAYMKRRNVKLWKRILNIISRLARKHGETGAYNEDPLDSCYEELSASITSGRINNTVLLELIGSLEKTNGTGIECVIDGEKTELYCEDPVKAGCPSRTLLITDYSRPFLVYYYDKYAYS